MLWWQCIHFTIPLSVYYGYLKLVQATLNRKISKHRQKMAIDWIYGLLHWRFHTNQLCHPCALNEKCLTLPVCPLLRLLVLDQRKIKSSWSLLLFGTKQMIRTSGIAHCILGKNNVLKSVYVQIPNIDNVICVYWFIVIFGFQWCTV